jgi:BirA family biotin operon repressor/biotin-[acetyl-CoA-carboxylase] ligase
LSNKRGYLNKSNTKLIGRRVHYYKELESTQDLAVFMADKSPLNGTVILAEQQLKGRGTLERKWISPRGGIWLSVILRPRIPPEKISFLGLVAALAVCDTIIEKTMLFPKIKWPNDIFLNHKKVSGILIDAATRGIKVEYAVVGIGINANVDLKKIISILDERKESSAVTSIKEELLGKRVNRPAFLRVLFERFEGYLFQLELSESGPMVILNKVVERLENSNAKQAVAQMNKMIEHLS